MIINNYHDKKYIETTNNEVVFYRWYGKRVLKKDKIRAAYMQDDYVVRILYGNIIRSYNICNIKNSQKIMLKEFIDSLNNEGLIFSGINYGDARGAIIYMITLFFSRSIISNGINIKSLIWLAIIIVLSISIIKYPIYDMFIYDYKNKVITVGSRFYKKKIEIKSIGKDIVNIKIKRSKSGEYTIKTKFNSILLQTNIIYPINYLKEMKEVY